MKVSIIIAAKRINDYIIQAMPFYLELDYNDLEILILPDEDSAHEFPQARIIPTGPIGPADKRDLALKYASGDILAFIDDDAYPRKNWLSNAIRHFSNPQIAAVGGPAVTPKDNTFWQKLSGAAFLSPLGGGNPDRYWPGEKIKEIDDWPSVNLLVRRDIFQQIGGFDSQYWPGEDTKLCRDIIKLGKKIIYDPQVLIWHHRRSGLLKHLKQIGSYGLHRGFFARNYPETSFKIKYFIPSIFFLALSIAPISWYLFPAIRPFFLMGLLIYVLALLFASWQIYQKENDILISLFSLPYIFFTHIYYGIRFVQGFIFTKNLKSKLAN